MATLDASEIFFVVRMAAALGLVLFMMVVFYTFKVDVHEDSMKRFVFELSDSITSSPLTDYKSVFSAQKLSDTERLDANRNIELYSTDCNYGYTLQVESLTGQTDCNAGNECVNFCKSACGLDDSTLDTSTTTNGNCGCSVNGNCECKKNNEWQDDYKWSYGYVPRSSSAKNVHMEFPVGLSVDSTVVPAKLTLTAYDSFLTRLSCSVAKAAELKEPSKIKFSRSDLLGATTFERKNNANHACLYTQDSLGQDNALECRYMPNLNFDRFQILQGFPADTINGVITAYPIKTNANCNEIKSNPSLMAGKDDAVSTVVLCAGTV